MKIGIGITTNLIGREGYLTLDDLISHIVAIDGLAHPVVVLVILEYVAVFPVEVLVVVEGGEFNEVVVIVVVVGGESD